MTMTNIGLYANTILNISNKRKSNILYTKSVLPLILVYLKDGTLNNYSANNGKRWAFICKTEKQIIFHYLVVLGLILMYLQ